MNERESIEAFREQDREYENTDHQKQRANEQAHESEQVKKFFYAADSSKNQAGAVIVWHEQENRLSSVPIDELGIGQDVRPEQVAQVAGSLITFTESLTSNIAVTKIEGLGGN